MHPDVSYTNARSFAPTAAQSATIVSTQSKPFLPRSQRAFSVAQLEELTRGTAVRGILPDGLVTVVAVKWIGTVAIEVTYKDAAGRLGSELLYRDREPTTGPGHSRHAGRQEAQE
jgi:hypothetical protein